MGRGLTAQGSAAPAPLNCPHLLRSPPPLPLPPSFLSLSHHLSPSLLPSSLSSHPSALSLAVIRGQPCNPSAARGSCSEHHLFCAPPSLPLHASLSVSMRASPSVPVCSVCPLFTLSAHARLYSSISACFPLRMCQCITASPDACMSVNVRASIRV